MPPARKRIIDRVMGKIDVLDGHWVWRGQVVKRKGVSPRPIMEVGGSKVGVRVALWREQNGEPPGPLAESCGEPLCVNPDHTSVGHKGGYPGKAQAPDWGFVDDEDFMTVVRRGCVRNAQRWNVDAADLEQEVLAWVATHGYIFDKGKNYATKYALLEGGKKYTESEWARDVLGPTGHELQFEAILSR